MTFGILEGFALLNDDLTRMDEIHGYYGGTIAFVSTAMGVGFWVYFANLFMTFRQLRKAEKRR